MGLFEIFKQVKDLFFVSSAMLLGDDNKLDEILIVASLWRFSSP